MSGKSNLRKLDLGIDEEKDIFLSSINKKIRNNRKKIEAIDDLAKRDKSTLNQEQLNKIKSKSEVLENTKYYETIKDMYYGAFKTAKDEGRLPQPTGQQAPATQTETTPATETVQPVTQQVQEVQEVDTTAITRENLSRVLNLVHVAQFFRDQNRAQEFRQAFESNRQNLQLDTVPDFESFYEFYAKIFNFSESDRFVKIGDKINGSLNELESYINAVDQPALRNISYSHLQQVVETLANSTSFRSHNAEVGARQVRTTAEPSAIGSELRRGQEQERTETATEQPVRSSPSKNQAKLRSPEKEPKVEQKTQQEGSAKKDWGTFEDEEENLEETKQEEVEEGGWEGEGGRAVEQEEVNVQPEEKAFNPYEDFVEVKGKQKEKKEEKPTRGGYGNRPYRGGYRGDRGPRGPRPEGEEGQTEGQQGGYRGGRGGYRGGYRPRTEGAEGQQEGGVEGENRNTGYRGRGGYRGQGRGGNRGGRGGFRGGDRGGFNRRPEEGVVRQEAPST